MLVLAVSKFEPDDLDRIPRRVAWKGIATLLALMGLPLVLIIAGVGLLLYRHGLAAGLAILPAIFAWVLSASVIQRQIKPPPIAPKELQRLVTVMSPMRMAFDDDRLRVEMPVGRSAFSYVDVAAWQTTATACYVRLATGPGVFVIPRHFISADVLADVETFLRGRNVRVIHSS